jgi:hypothetical protein
MIKMETEILIKDVIINKSGHLNTFLEGYNSQVFFNMYFLSLIQMFSLNVFIVITTVSKHFLKISFWLPSCL